MLVFDSSVAFFEASLMATLHVKMCSLGFPHCCVVFNFTTYDGSIPPVRCRG